MACCFAFLISRCNLDEGELLDDSEDRLVSDESTDTDVLQSSVEAVVSGTGNTDTSKDKSSTQSSLESFASPGEDG